MFYFFNIEKFYKDLIYLIDLNYIQSTLIFHKILLIYL